MNADLLPDEFWDWLENGSPQNNEVLGLCYARFLMETSGLQPAGNYMFFSLEDVKPKRPKLQDNFERDYIAYLNKKLKEKE